MNLPTYPARPINGGRLEQAPEKSGRWFCEPKYNGWRVLIHAPSGAMFNRHGARLSIAREFGGALALLKSSAHEWLDGEALERRHRIGRGTLLIFDTPRTGTYELRKAALPFPVHQIETKPGENLVLSVPHFECGQGSALELYAKLRGINAEWGCTFYEGLVFKRSGSLYPIQLRSSGLEFPAWVKHRWI